MTLPTSAAKSSNDEVSSNSATMPPSALSGGYHTAVNCDDSRPYQFDWTADSRVASILKRIDENGAPITHYEDYSDSSAGQKTYWYHGGEDVAELKLIYAEYLGAAYEAHVIWLAPGIKSKFSPFSLFSLLPTVEDLVRYIKKDWIDYRGSDRVGYFAKLDAIFPMQAGS
jgi:hypothetical protein